MDRPNDYDPTIVGSAWEEAPLYKIIDIFGLVLRADEKHLLTGIMLDLCNAQRIRPSQRWARIKVIPAVEKSPLVAGSITTTGLGGNLDGQDANPAQRDNLLTMAVGLESEYSASA